jgi:hypothetical protein
MHESFWPQLPIFIPSSPGLHFGFQVVWWLFQICVMGGTLIVLQRLGMLVDRQKGGE